ncbi:hypothetical protein CEXT_565021 [Caerostris extrusa]|uniref:Uncharacterized protein n=1 Tax=Caerostris extrusa TaxID=172846 RepID=A0AAV4RHB6_CAEEX|nr:hypothetical protein CEXT_565021 [Caerostris extrusa]
MLADVKVQLLGRPLGVWKWVVQKSSEGKTGKSKPRQSYQKLRDISLLRRDVSGILLVPQTGTGVEPGDIWNVKISAVDNRTVWNDASKTKNEILSYFQFRKKELPTVFFFYSRFRFS